MRAILVSNEMFERVLAMAQLVAEEQFRRLVFDTEMSAEAAAECHDIVVDRLMDRYVANVAHRALEYRAQQTRNPM